MHCFCCGIWYVVDGFPRDEFVRHGRLEHFDRLKVFLLGQADVPYADLARQLDTSECALKTGIHRLRKRYRDLLREEIAETVSDPAEVEGELRYLAVARTIVDGHRVSPGCRNRLVVGVGDQRLKVMRIRFQTRRTWKKNER